MHTPARHVSVWVQALPSLQAVPSFTGVWTHTLSTQVSVVHTLLSLQSALVLQQLTTGPPGMQVPFRQVSGLVQGFLSLLSLSSALAGFEQMPVPVSHVPALWHWSDAVQTTGLPPTHVPL